MNKQQWRNRIDELEKELVELKNNPPKREPGERWKPEDGELYWIVGVGGDLLYQTWCGDSHDVAMFDNFNIFETEEEAEFARERTKVMRELDTWAMDKFTLNKTTYGLYFDPIGDGEVIVTPWFDIYTSHVFKSREVAEKAIESVGEERLKKYYFKVVD